MCPPGCGMPTQFPYEPTPPTMPRTYPRVRAVAGSPKKSASSTATGRAPIAKTSRRMPPTPVAAPWNGSTADGWLRLSTLKTHRRPPPRSTAPAFSPGPTATRGRVVGSVRRSFFECLYAQCSLHIAPNIAHSSGFGSRSRRARMRSASGSVRPNSRGMSCCLGCAVAFPEIVGEMLMPGRGLRSAPRVKGYRSARPATRARIGTKGSEIDGPRPSGTEVLEEAEGPVLAGVVVFHALPLQGEALRADERRFLDDEALRQHDARVDRLLRDRVADVLVLDGERVARAHVRQDPVDVDLVTDELRPVQLREGLAEDGPRATGASFDQCRERRALRLVGALVDEAGRDAVPFVDRLRPVRVEADGEAVERRVAEPALLDAPGPAALAVTVRRTRVHVAGAAVVAVAGDRDRPLEHPGRRFRVSHQRPPDHMPPVVPANSGRSSTRAASATSTTPITRPNATPRGAIFSTNTAAAMTTAQTRLMEPAATNTAMSAQQQPRQYSPCSTPVRKEPLRPRYQCVRRKSAGVRHARRQTLFRGVS